ncbi:MAG: hypothetical protein UZ16_OP3001003058 [Candidatus Hinthialibacteria bacterium OLB16]|nr:MAG: hypothetical protein UZ16_OP3001003058 [Candidatus Hinthialibacteria bacterium OLB16]
MGERGAFSRRATKEVLGVEQYCLESSTWIPWAASTWATSTPNSRERNRRSYPTIATGFCFCSRATWPVAAAATATRSKVKSRAISPRQPSVPNLMRPMEFSLVESFRGGQDGRPMFN